MSLIRTRAFTCPALTCLLALGACVGADPELAASPATDPELAASPATDPPAGASTASHAARLPRAPVSPAAARAAAALTGTLQCNLEYVRFEPFAWAAIASFSQPMSVVATQEVSATSGGLGIYAVVNPTPSTNLSFEVGAFSATETLLYNVMPPPSIGGAWLFETGRPVATVTIGGVAYDHIRTYCSLRP
jgi:hypothetical protein